MAGTYRPLLMRHNAGALGGQGPLMSSEPFQERTTRCGLFPLLQSTSTPVALRARRATGVLVLCSNGNRPHRVVRSWNGSLDINGPCPPSAPALCRINSGLYVPAIVMPGYCLGTGGLICTNNCRHRGAG